MIKIILDKKGPDWTISFRCSGYDYYKLLLWCEENCFNKFHINGCFPVEKNQSSSPYAIWFETESDAATFKLNFA